MDFENGREPTEVTFGAGAGASPPRLLLARARAHRRGAHRGHLWRAPGASPPGANPPRLLFAGDLVGRARDPTVAQSPPRGSPSRAPTEFAFRKRPCPVIVRISDCPAGIRPRELANPEYDTAGHWQGSCYVGGDAAPANALPTVLPGHALLHPATVRMSSVTGRLRRSDTAPRSIFRRRAHGTAKCDDRAVALVTRSGTYVMIAP